MISERAENIVVGLLFAFVIPISVVWGLDELGIWGASHAFAFWAGLSMIQGINLLQPEIQRLSPYHEVSET